MISNAIIAWTGIEALEGFKIDYACDDHWRKAFGGSRIGRHQNNRPSCSRFHHSLHLPSFLPLDYLLTSTSYTGRLHQPLPLWPDPNWTVVAPIDSTRLAHYDNFIAVSPYPLHIDFEMSRLQRLLSILAQCCFEFKMLTTLSAERRVYVSWRTNELVHRDCPLQELKCFRFDRYLYRLWLSEVHCVVKGSVLVVVKILGSNPFE